MKLEVVHGGIKEFTVDLKHTPTAANPDVRMNVLLQQTRALLIERGWTETNCGWLHLSYHYYEVPMEIAMIEEANKEL